MSVVTTVVQGSENTRPSRSKQRRFAGQGPKAEKAKKIAKNAQRDKSQQEDFKEDKDRVARKISHLERNIQRSKDRSAEFTKRIEAERSAPNKDSDTVIGSFSGGITRQQDYVNSATSRLEALKNRLSSFDSTNNS